MTTDVRDELDISSLALETAVRVKLHTLGITVKSNRPRSNSYDISLQFDGGKYFIETVYREGGDAYLRGVAMLNDFSHRAQMFIVPEEVATSVWMLLAYGESKGMEEASEGSGWIDQMISISYDEIFIHNRSARLADEMSKAVVMSHMFAICEERKNQNARG